MLRPWLSWSVRAHTSLFSSPPFTLLILPYSYITSWKTIKKLNMVWCLCSGGQDEVYMNIFLTNQSDHNMPLQILELGTWKQPWLLVIGEHSLIHSTEEGRICFPMLWQWCILCYSKRVDPVSQQNQHLGSLFEMQHFRLQPQLVSPGIRNLIRSWGYACTLSLGNLCVPFAQLVCKASVKDITMLFHGFRNSCLSSHRVNSSCLTS